MSSADLLPAARTILGVLGVCLAKPADATGLTLALILGGFPGDAARWVDPLAQDLTQDMARLNLPAQIRALIPQMLAAADPSPAQITTDLARATRPPRRQRGSPAFFLAFWPAIWPIPTPALPPPLPLPSPQHRTTLPARPTPWPTAPSRMPSALASPTACFKPLPGAMPPPIRPTSPRPP